MNAPDRNLHMCRVSLILMFNVDTFKVEDIFLITQTKCFLQKCDHLELIKGIELIPRPA